MVCGCVRTNIASIRCVLGRWYRLRYVTGVTCKQKTQPPVPEALVEHIFFPAVAEARCSECVTVWNQVEKLGGPAGQSVTGEQVGELKHSRGVEWPISEGRVEFV